MYNKKNIEYKGFNLTEVFIGLLAKIDSNSSISKKNYLYLFLRHKINLQNSDYILVTNSSTTKRKDFSNIFSFLLSKIKCKYEYLTVKDNSLSGYFSVMNIFKSYFIINKFYNHMSIWKRMLLTSYMTYILNTIDYLLKNNTQNFKIKKMISFMPIYGVENVILQFLKINNTELKCYMIQHAIFQTDKNFNSIDSLIYENFNVDFLLSWSNYTIDEYKKFINKRKLLLVGPLKEYKLKPFKNSINKKIYVFLSGVIYKEINIEVLKMLNKISTYDFFIKLHPSDKYNNYINYLNENINITDKEILDIFNEDIGIIISVNTTVYYESYLNGIISLKYINKKTRKFHDISDDSFRNKSELESLLNSLNTLDMSAEELYLLKNNLEYVTGVKIDNYEEVICK